MLRLALAVFRVVVVAEERLLAAVAALGDVMRHARSHHPRKPRHTSWMEELVGWRQLGIVSPELLVSGAPC